MPWRERSLVSVRQDFILRALTRDVPIAELCRQFGVSRKTAYKWLKRFRERGPAGLVDRPRRPRSNGKALSSTVVMHIVRLKQKHRSWGAKKLLVLLARTLDADELPSISSINRVLYQSGLVLRRRRYRRSSTGLPIRPNVVVEAPNDLWTVDFKGWWRAGNGDRCEPLTVRDAHSRFVLELRLMTSTRTAPVREVFEELFERWGLPKAIQSDNGPPFASVRALGGLTGLSAWWMSLGIEVVRSRPGKPTDNGGHERMHADVRVEIQADAAHSRKLQQQACDEWRTEFNHVRPHEALGMKTPAEVYRASSRRPGRIVVGGAYPEGTAVERVSSRGTVGNTSGAWGVYVSLALAGYPVGLEERADRFVYVWFFDRVLGRYQRGDRTVQPVPVDDREAALMHNLEAPAHT